MKFILYFMLLSCFSVFSQKYDRNSCVNDRKVFLVTFFDISDTIVETFKKREYHQTLSYFIGDSINKHKSIYGTLHPQRLVNVKMEIRKIRLMKKVHYSECYFLHAEDPKIVHFIDSMSDLLSFQDFVKLNDSINKISENQINNSFVDTNNRIYILYHKGEKRGKTYYLRTSKTTAKVVFRISKKDKAFLKENGQILEDEKLKAIHYLLDIYEFIPPFAYYIYKCR